MNLGKLLIQNHDFYNINFLLIKQSNFDFMKSIMSIFGDNGILKNENVILINRLYGYILI